MNSLGREMADCIEKCLSCYSLCLQTAISARFAETNTSHLVLMLACAEMCRTCAHFMLLETPHHKHTCRECAEICKECALACEKVGGMQDCADACRECAQACLEMAA